MEMEVQPSAGKEKSLSLAQVAARTFWFYLRKFKNTRAIDLPPKEGTLPAQPVAVHTASSGPPPQSSTAICIV